jgi:hypothetical protein
MEPQAVAEASSATPPVAPVVMEPDPDVERGLLASVKVLNFAKGRLEELGEAECVQVSKDELVMLRRAAIAMNNSITRVVKKTNAAEDRLLLEVHLIRQTMAKELTDRDANRARVYEQLRRYQVDEDGTAAASTVSTTTPHHSNPLLAPSQAQVSVDRALAAVARIEQSMTTLNPMGTTHVHGAGLIAAHNTCVAAASAE